MLQRLILALYGLYALGVLLTVVLLVTIMLIFVPGLQRRRRMAQFGARAAFRLAAIPICIHGTAALEHPCVVVANHASYLDGMVLFAVLPADFRFVIKREMTRVPVASLLLRRLGMHFVERFDSARGAVDARRIIRDAVQGQRLAAFPEGTFNKQPGLGRFHGGVFRAAVASGLAVVPVTISGTRSILPDGRRLPVPGRITIDIHAAIAVDTNGGRAEVQRVSAASRQAILQTLGEPDLVAD